MAQHNPQTSAMFPAPWRRLARTAAAPPNCTPRCPAKCLDLRCRTRAQRIPPQDQHLPPLWPRRWRQLRCRLRAHLPRPNSRMLQSQLVRGWEGPGSWRVGVGGVRTVGVGSSITATEPKSIGRKRPTPSRQTHRWFLAVLSIRYAETWRLDGVRSYTHAKHSDVARGEGGGRCYARALTCQRAAVPDGGIETILMHGAVQIAWLRSAGCCEQMHMFMQLAAWPGSAAKDGGQILCICAYTHIMEFMHAKLPLGHPL